MRRLSVSALCALVGMWGCAMSVPPPESVGPTVEPIDAPLNEVWEATLTAFTDLNIPIENMERASGFIRSDEMVAGAGTQISGHSIEEIADCGIELTVPRTTSGTTYLAFTVLLRESSPSETSMRIQSAIRNYEEAGLMGANITCASTGLFEDLMLEEVRDRLGI